MLISPILKQVYSSNPQDPALDRVLTLEIRMPSETLYFVQDKEDHLLGGKLYKNIPVDIALPDKDSSGTQKLRFALGIMDGSINILIQDALDSGKVIYIVCSEWLLGYRDAPARVTPPMPVEGGSLGANGSFQVDASYFDLLNLSWPRQRYTAENAPGIKYM